MTNDLLERVRAATGPIAQLDAEIYATIGGAPHTAEAGRRIVPFVMRADPKEWPEYTASVDDALALVERRLPGVWYVLAKGRMTSSEPLFGCELLFGHDTQLAIAEGHTQALAILAALLSALPATPEKPHDE